MNAARLMTTPRAGVARAGRALARVLRAAVHDVRVVGVALVGVLVIVVALAGGSAAAPSAPPVHNRTAAITTSTLVCPQVGAPGKDGVSRVGYAAPPSDPSQLATTATQMPLQGGAVSSNLPIPAGHAWVVDGSPTTASPLRIDADGPDATLLSAVQFSRTVDGAQLQAAATSCSSPTNDAWFAGFASGVGDQAELLLSNVDTLQASVDVSIYADQNNPDLNAAASVLVEPGSQVVLHLDTLDPGAQAAVAHVVVTQGRVVPALLYTAVNGSIPVGSDWLPATRSPSTSQTVTGIAPGAGSRALVVADPNQNDATISVKLVAASGEFTPTTLSSVTVPAGTVTSIPLDSQLNGDAAAAVVTSSVPVVAGAVSTLPPDSTGATDLAFGAAVPAIAGSAVISGSETATDRHTSLLLSAPGTADADLTVTQLPYTAATAPSSQRVRVAAGTTLVLDLATLGADDPGPGVLVTPDTPGTVWGAWVLTEDSKGAAGDITSVPLRSPVRTRSLGVARIATSAGLP